MFRLRRDHPEVVRPTVPVIREDYRTQRQAFVRSLVDVERDEGLEIGAFDLATILPEQGRCEFADWRSTDDLASEFNVPHGSIARVTYVLDRARPLPEQIPRRFDYVVLCHVLEHVPDPIGFLTETAQLVHDGGVVLLAIPDKRQTPDAPRPSTTVDQLLARHHAGARTPSLDQIMEFARAWSDEWRALAERSPREFYAWAVSIFDSGRGDAHCNVWQDEELFAQLDYLIRGGFLRGVELVARGPTLPPFNEFYVALRRVGAAS